MATYLAESVVACLFPVSFGRSGDLSTASPPVHLSGFAPQVSRLRPPLRLLIPQTPLT